MTMPPGGFPFGGGAPGGMPGAGAPPGYQQPAAAAQWVLDIPADPNWQPIEATDTLAQDGYFMCKIVGEKITEKNNKISVIMTLEIQDPDMAGKKISRFLQDPRQTTGDTWWQWRGLLRSITGTIEQAQGALRYTPGMFTGHPVYVKSEAYNDDKGSMRTGVGAWVTRAEWEEAYKAGGTKYRWQPAPRQSGPAQGAGALPPGLPASFGGLPGGGGGGMPQPPQTAGFPPQGGFPPPQQQPQGGFPPAQQTTPQPTGMPMQQAAPPQTAFPPQQPAMTPPPPAQQAAPPPAQGGFSFPPPANGAATPQPPTAAGMAANFPFPPR